MKKVKCMETQKVYQSAREAGKELNISYKAISKCINGKSKSAGGYHFIRESEKNDQQKTAKISINIEDINIDMAKVNIKNIEIVNNKTFITLTIVFE